jgi:hypothetical protein
MQNMQHLLQKRCRATSRYRSARPPKNAHQEEPKGLPTQASPLTHSGLKTDINAIVEPNAPSVTSTSVRSVGSIVRMDTPHKLQHGQDGNTALLSRDVKFLFVSFLSSE